MLYEIKKILSSEAVWRCSLRSYLNFLIAIFLFFISFAAHNFVVNFCIVILTGVIVAFEIAIAVFEAKYGLKREKKDQSLDSKIKIEDIEDVKLICVVVLIVILIGLVMKGSYILLFTVGIVLVVIFFLADIENILTGIAQNILKAYSDIEKVFTEIGLWAGKLCAFVIIVCWIVGIFRTSNNACMILTIAAVMVPICQNLKKFRFCSFADMLSFIGLMVVGIYSFVDIVPGITWTLFWNLASLAMLGITVVQSCQFIAENEKALEENKKNEDKKVLEEQEKNKEIRSKIEEILTKNLEQLKKDNSAIDVSEITQEIMDTIKGSR